MERATMRSNVPLFRSSGARFCGPFCWSLARLDSAAGVTEVRRSIALTVLNRQT